jgi:hypothetical protein
VTPAVIIRQRKPWRRKEGTYIYFEDNAGVIVNPKGEMKGERRSTAQHVLLARLVRLASIMPARRKETAALTGAAVESNVIQELDTGLLFAAFFASRGQQHRPSMAALQALPSPAPWQRSAPTCGLVLPALPTPSCRGEQQAGASEAGAAGSSRSSHSSSTAAISKPCCA